MADKPILFSGPMVRALLDGRKTQTRRVLPVYEPKAGPGVVPKNVGYLKNERKVSTRLHRLPRYEVGDRLWVKETIFRCEKCSYSNHVEGGNRSAGGKHFHCAACDALFEGEQTPSIFMPRIASRLTLTVTDVRVERLQDISEADAIAEGIEDVTNQITPSDRSLRFWKRYRDGGWNKYVDTAIGSYASLWTEINGPGSWEANPWVAAYTFTVQNGNIDGPKP